MRLLLDTHVVLWELAGTRTLGPKAHEAVERATELTFSVVSFAEIGVKSAIGKLSVPDDLRDHVANTGLQILGLAPEHGLGVGDLPMHHRDPFDRLLISQARREGLTILTADSRLGQYDVATLDATI